MQLKRIILFIVYASLITACGANAATIEAANGTANTSNSGFKFSPIAHAHTAELLEFITNYAGLEESHQKSVYMGVMQELAKDKSDVKLKIKHAAILTLPNSTLRDTLLAQQQLKALLEEQSLNDSNASLVKLLYAFTLDHNTQSQKVRDAAKKSEALKQRNNALSQKLNDLKNIEKTMIERNAKTN